MTLIEVLVTSSLLLFFATGAVLVMISGQRSWLASRGQADAFQAGQVALARISRELQFSSSAFLTDNTSLTPPAFSFPSAFDSQGRFTTTVEGYADWQKFVVYYVPAKTQLLLRKELFTVPTDPTVDPVLSQSSLSAACDGKGALVASGVTSLVLTPSTTTSEVVLALGVQLLNPNGRTDRITWTVSIVPRN